MAEETKGSVDPAPTADSYLAQLPPPRKEYTRHHFQDWDTCIQVANECGKLGWRIIHIDEQHEGRGKYRDITVVFERCD